MLPKVMVVVLAQFLQQKNNNNVALLWNNFTSASKAVKALLQGE